MMFSVEIKGGDSLADGEAELEIFLDREALDDLLTQLSFLRVAGGHAHFMSPSWGGTELSEEVVRPGNQCVHHLRLPLVGGAEDEDSE